MNKAIVRCSMFCRFFIFWSLSVCFIKCSIICTLLSAHSTFCLASDATAVLFAHTSQSEYNHFSMPRSSHTQTSCCLDRKNGKTPPYLHMLFFFCIIVVEFQNIEWAIAVTSMWISLFSLHGSDCLMAR